MQEESLRNSRKRENSQINRPLKRNNAKCRIKRNQEIAPDGHMTATKRETPIEITPGKSVNMKFFKWIISGICGILSENSKELERISVSLARADHRDISYRQLRTGGL